MELLNEFVNNFFVLANAMSIYIIVGLFVAGVLKQLIPDDFVSKQLGKNSTMSVIKATILGIPLPVCSCSVIPLAQSLKKEGASKGSVQSFLISTPITGVDSILATFSFFGLIFTIFRVVSSVIIAIIVGLIQNFVEEKDEAKEQIKNKQKFNFSANTATLKPNTPMFTAQKQTCSSTKETTSCGCSSSKKRGFSFVTAISYGYGMLFSDMAKALLIGLLLGAVFTTFIPQEYSKLLFENQILTYFVILAFAMPLYTCATASLPIAAAFMLQGMSAGAAFVFLTAGPATSMVTMSIVYKLLGRTSLIIYTTTIAILSLIFGYVFDTYFPKLDILTSMHEHEDSSILFTISTIIMLGLIFYHLLKDKFKPKKASCCQ